MREDYGSEGLPPLADGARRAKKRAGVGFLPPESKGRSFGSDVDRNRTSTPSDWASDLRRGPRGVLKRKGEVIGGYAVAVARARGADAGGASGVDAGIAFEEERGKIVGRSASEGIADEEAIRPGTWRRQHYPGGERIDWLEESRRARERSVELVSEGLNEVIKVGRGGVLKYRPNKKVFDSEKPSCEGRRKSSEGVHLDVKSPVGIGIEGLRKSPEKPVRIRAEARRKSPEDAIAEYDRKIPVGIGMEGHRKSVELVNYGAGTNERSLVPEEKKIRGDDELVPSVSHVDKEKEKSKSKSPSMDEVARDGGSVLGVKLDSKECDPKTSDCDLVALEASCSTRRGGMGMKKVSRGSEKQKVREQIKSMLLNAGWKIELRPRKNRDYEDSVYVSPQGTGYWSITKAYDAFQSQLKHASSAGNLIVDNKSRKPMVLERNGENLCEQNGGPSSALSTDALSILKRNVVNKRGSKKYLKDNIQRPSGRMKTSTQRKSITDLNTNPPSSDEIPQNSSEDCCSLEGRSRRQRGCTLLPRNFDRPDSVGAGYTPYDGKRTILSWMIDLETLPANGKVEYMNKKRTRALLEGWITRDGIHCSCCSKILSVSKFEIHAGSKQRQPYQNIFVESSGSSLLQCLLAAWRSQEKYKGSGFCSAGISNSDPNDDMCGICGDGGDLICCDGCPSVFHLSCLGIEMLPRGDWHCSTCSCKFCGEVDNNASCSTSSSNLRICYLCQEKYHQDCTPEVVMPSSGCSNSYTSFCGSSCKKVHEKLQNLLGVKNELDAGLSWSVAQSSDVDSMVYPSDIVQRAECSAKVAVALEVLEECFLPIIDKMSGINMINNVAFNHGSNFPRLNFRGVYTFILERDDEIISVASIRISGTKFAEMPFIGTRVRYRNQGMCHLLLKSIESALSSLDIEKLVIPAVPQLFSVWTKAFGFAPLDGSLLHEIKSTNAITFPGMGLLIKTLPTGKDSSGHRDAPRGSVFNACQHQPPALVSSKRSRSNPVTDINYEIKGKKLGNLSGEDEVEFTYGNAFKATKGLGEDTPVADHSFDGIPGPVTHNLVGSRKLTKANRFLKSAEHGILRASSPVSPDNRKKRRKTCGANSAALSEDMVSDSCHNEETDACVAPNGDDMSGYSDRCSNGKAVSVTNGKSCYLF